MSKGRLTRQELTWLLSQEGQNAAFRLREGVQVLRRQTPLPAVPESAAHNGGEADSGHHPVDASLDALDDVMKMLTSLNQRQSVSHLAAPRRGRVDLAAIIVEVAPEARVSIEPGSGTEVYGEENDLRRMIQVLIGAGEGSSITVRGTDDEVRIAVTLGPEMSPTAATERAWLSRMALRYGGRHELEGGTEMLVLPASTDRESVREDVAKISSVPPAPAPSTDRFEAMTKICAGVAAELRRRLGENVTAVDGLLASLGSIGVLRAHEFPTEIDLLQVMREAAREGSAAGEANRVVVTVRSVEPSARIYVRAGAKTLTALVREIVAHAVAASPAGGVVETAVAEDSTGVRVIVDDAGAPLAASSRRAFLALEAQGDRHGRPSALPLFLAAELAAGLGARLELTDPPAHAGLRVTVTFPAPV